MAIQIYRERVARCEGFRFTGDPAQDFTDLAQWLQERTGIAQGCGMNYRDGGFIHLISGEFIKFSSRDILTIEEGRIVVNSPEEFGRKWERQPDMPWKS